MTHEVKRLWITPNAEASIVHQARVSNPDSQREGKDPERLLRYLIRHKHWSPFETASLSVEINTTRDIAAQLLRHRSFCFQEFSQRYADPSALGLPTIPELRLQDPKNRQASLEDSSGTLARLFDRRIQAYFDLGQLLYQDMVALGVAKECARKVLPLQTPSRLYMTGTLRSWIHYLQVRTGPETQKEHRLIADDIAGILSEECPNIYRAALCTESTTPPSKLARFLNVFQRARSTTAKLSEYLAKGRIWPIV